MQVVLKLTKTVCLHLRGISAELFVSQERLRSQLANSLTSVNRSISRQSSSGSVQNKVSIFVCSCTETTHSLYPSHFPSSQAHTLAFQPHTACTHTHLHFNPTPYVHMPTHYQHQLCITQMQTHYALNPTLHAHTELFTSTPHCTHTHTHTHMLCTLIPYHVYAHQSTPITYMYTYPHALYISTPHHTHSAHQSHTTHSHKVKFLRGLCSMEVV